MQSTVKNKTWEEITEKIESAGEIISKQKQLLGRIRKVEEEKETVPKKIYEKVRDEYDIELTELDKELSPLEKDAHQAREEIEAEIKELDTMISATKDQITEIEFRQRVGEYDSKTMESKAKPLKDKFSELSSRKEELLKTFEKFDILFDDIRDLESAHANISHEDSSSPGDDPEISDDKSASDEQKLSGEFANIKVGIEPEEERESLADTKDSMEKELTIEDPLVELADPSFDDSFDSSLNKRAHEQERTSHANTGKSTPMLRILKGSSKDKIIPVLPITMTIGREHDNNIELKDEDVSRYHARIIHENGKYVLETLENTTGTWLNGKNISRSELQDSDIIKIGQTELGFEWK